MASDNPFLLTDAQIAENNVKDRSFIDLSFDGQAISDFGLVVVFDGQTQNEYLTPQFTNNTSTIPGRDGLIVWGTDISNNTLSRTLATEQMSSRQYRAFKNWLQPGKIAKLILAQRPYCYAWAMLQSVPQFNFVPFDKQIKIGSQTYTDVIYRGSAQVNWTLVQPHWYSALVDIKDYIGQSWIFESGVCDVQLADGATLQTGDNVIILDKTVLGSQGTIFFASEDWRTMTKSKYYSELTNKAFKVYNAGNVAAKCNLQFKVTPDDYKYQINTSNKVTWSNIIITVDDQTQTIIGQPRAFSDIDYTLNLVKKYQSSYADNKTKIINDLIENLDSNSVFRGQIIHFVNRQTSFTTLRDQLNILINSATYTFTINSDTHQMTMQVSMPNAVHWQDTNAPTYVYEQDGETKGSPLVMDQNIQGASNGKYISIAGNNSLIRTLTCTPLVLSISGIQLTECKVHFLNEYV